MKKPLVLCILDGIGINLDDNYNAVAIAKTPFLDSLIDKYPHAQLNASGVSVGLPEGTMGNSEVGHITMGAGRVVNQFLRRFQIEDWDKNQPLQQFITDVKAAGGVVHIAGLMSDGRVHADVRDIMVIAKQILASGLRVCIHFIADGRDTLPQSAEKYVAMIKDSLCDAFASGQAFWGTLSGRYWAMDRNQNMDRTMLAVDAIANAHAQYNAPTIDAALQDAYARGETDEFIRPTVIAGDVPITPKDGFVFGNYRSDRARQIMREIVKTGAKILCFSQYGEGLNEVCPALLNDEQIVNTLGDVLAQNGLSQLRIAETEKYNHVTYFFDAERNVDFTGGKKVLIPSPDVATFDMKPEMSAVEITDALLPILGDYDVVILNYANGDMVGHTGNLDAAVRAVEVLDAQLARLVPAVLKLGGKMLITADHGNAEMLWDSVSDTPWTAHTTNPVRVILVADNAPALHNGGLADVAPTILKLLNIPQPEQMTGKSLV